jgi:hypothetical protein
MTFNWTSIGPFVPIAFSILIIFAVSIRISYRAGYKSGYDKGHHRGAAQAEFINDKMNKKIPNPTDKAVASAISKINRPTVAFNPEGQFSFFP